MRQIETLHIGVAGVIGLLGGLALGYGTLLQTDGLWGLVSFSGVLLIPALLGLAARPVLIPEPVVEEIESDSVAEEPSDEKVHGTATVEAAEFSGEVEAGAKVEATLKSSVPTLLEMVPIPGGSFMMGSDKNDKMADDREFPRHKVNLDGFELAKTQLTRGQYIDVIGDQSRPDQWSDDSNPDLPANYISWFDAIEFCNTLSEREGFEPCYQRDGDNVQWMSGTNGYRLPTEAEWEYACRAGSDTRWFFGDDETQLKDYNWYHKNSGKKVRPVALLKANTFGLYDMSGNIWEWCWDWYGDYTDEEQNSPIGPDKSAFRSLRGGSAWDVAWDLRSAGRGWLQPEVRLNDFGFRCARVPAASS